MLPYCVNIELFICIDRVFYQREYKVGAEADHL